MAQPPNNSSFTGSSAQRVPLLLIVTLQWLGSGALALLRYRTRLPSHMGHQRSIRSSVHILQETLAQVRTAVACLLETIAIHIRLKHGPQPPLPQLQTIILALVIAVCYAATIRLLTKHHDGIASSWMMRFLMGAWSAVNCVLLAELLWGSSAGKEAAWGLPINFLLQSYHWDLGHGEGVGLRKEAFQRFVRWRVSLRNRNTGRGVTDPPMSTE